MLSLPLWTKDKGSLWGQLSSMKKGGKYRVIIQSKKTIGTKIITTVTKLFKYPPLSYHFNIIEVKHKGDKILIDVKYIKEHSAIALTIIVGTLLAVLAIFGWLSLVRIDKLVDTPSLLGLGLLAFGSIYLIRRN